MWNIWQPVFSECSWQLPVCVVSVPGFCSLGFGMYQWRQEVNLTRLNINQSQRVDCVHCGKMVQQYNFIFKVLMYLLSKMIRLVKYIILTVF